VADATEVQRRLVAVFAADVEGYSRLMGADEVATLKGLTERRAILDKAIGDHRGRIANTAGDSVLAEFGSAVDAVQCAAEAQASLAEANASLSPDKRINFRIGIHVGDVMVCAGDLFGDGVNIAARLQTLAQPGGVCVSGVAYDQVRKVLQLTFTDLGLQQVKNIEEPIRAYAANSGGPQGPNVSQERLPALPDKPSIAVLPFQNMSGDPEQEYFADGIAEDIITALSRFKSLFVIARNSSFTYKGKSADIRQVGRELGVRYVLEGSVRKAGGRLRITGQLIEAATNKHLWADRFDGPVEDVFELQDNITAKVVGAIAPRLARANLDEWSVRPRANLESYDYFMRARVAGRERRLREAAQLYLKSAELDPKFALGYARAANCFVTMSVNQMGLIAEDDQLRAIELAEQALSIASDDAEVLATVARVLLTLKGEVEQGYALTGRAVDLNPNLAFAWTIRSLASSMLGEHLRALEEIDRALRLNPIDPVLVPSLLWERAACYFYLGRYEEGIRSANDLLLFKPNDLMGLFNLAVQTPLAGRVDDAQRALERLRKAYPDLTVSRLRQHQERSYIRFYQPQDRAKLKEACESLGAQGLPE
jgi:adenylate cyclase